MDTGAKSVLPPLLQSGVTPLLLPTRAPGINMVAEACYARFSLLLVGLAAGLALMGTLTAIMLVEEVS